MDLAIALAASVGGVAVLYASWRRPHGWKRLTAVIGWLAIWLSAVFWIRFGGTEFGVAYVAMAVACTAWSLAWLGREMRRPEQRRRQPRVSRAAPGWAAVMHTLARTVVAVPLAGAASLLVSVLVAAGLPWVTTNRYVFAILVAPIVWGILAMWAGMTARLARVALVLAGMSAACAALLFAR